MAQQLLSASETFNTTPLDLDVLQTGQVCTCLRTVYWLLLQPQLYHTPRPSVSFKKMPSLLVQFTVISHACLPYALPCLFNIWLYRRQILWVSLARFYPLSSLVPTLCTMPWPYQCHKEVSLIMTPTGVLVIVP